MRNLKNLSSSEIYAHIEDLSKSGHSAFQQQCEALYELYKRGEKHPFFKGKGHEKIYRSFESVALGRITPALVAYFSGNEKKISRFTSYGSEIQNIISANRPFSIAVVDSETGEIIKGEKTVRKMSDIELEIAFPGNGYLATFMEQRMKLYELNKEFAPKTPALPKVRTYGDNSIAVRNNIVTLEELTAVLSELGYDIVKK